MDHIADLADVAGRLFIELDMNIWRRCRLPLVAPVGRVRECCDICAIEEVQKE